MKTNESHFARLTSKASPTYITNGRGDQIYKHSIWKTIIHTSAKCARRYSFYTIRCWHVDNNTVETKRLWLGQTIRITDMTRGKVRRNELTENIYSTLCLIWHAQNSFKCIRLHTYIHIYLFICVYIYVYICLYVGFQFKLRSKCTIVRVTCIT